MVFRDSEPLDIQNNPLFEAAYPAAHTLAYLRIAMTVTRAGTRLTTNLPGSALVGWVLHPLDDELIFKEGSHPLFPPDQPFLVAPTLMVLVSSGFSVLPGFAPAAEPPFDKLRALCFGKSSQNH